MAYFNPDYFEPDFFSSYLVPQTVVVLAPAHFTNTPVFYTARIWRVVRTPQRGQPYFLLPANRAVDVFLSKNREDVKVFVDLLSTKSWYVLNMATVLTSTIPITVYSNEDLRQTFVVRRIMADAVVVGKPTLDQTEPVDLTDLTLLMGVLDSRGTLLASWTSAGSDGIEITDPTEGEFTLAIDSAELDPLKGKPEMTYDIKWVGPGDDDKRLWGGPFTVERGAAP
jgi:hypothetical protein